MQKRRKKKIFKWLLILCLLCIWGYFRTVSIEKQAHYVPTYEKENIAPLLEKQMLSSDDYRILFYQTGLSRSVIDKLLSEKRATEILLLQEHFFAPVSVSCTPNTILSKEEQLIDQNGNFVQGTTIPLVEEGDILITSACHALGWRNGHAGIVINASCGTTLEAVVLGQNTSTQHISKWEHYPNFIILRLRGVSKEKRAEIAATAASRLLHIPYWLLPSKNTDSSELSSTHCAHLVWYAYMLAGYDLDSNGGPIVTPENLAKSPFLEVVQLYGFPPDAFSN